MKSIIKRVLFICSANVNRSPAFERVSKLILPQTYPLIHWEIKSAGLYYGYPFQVNNEILDWADYIFVMDLGHEMFISNKYPEIMKKLTTIGVSDQYDTDSEELKEIILYWLKTYFGKIVGV